MSFDEMNVRNYETYARNIEGIAFSLGHKAPREATVSIITSMGEIVSEYDPCKDDNNILWALLDMAGILFDEYDNDEQRQSEIEAALNNVIAETKFNYCVEVA